MLAFLATVVAGILLFQPFLAGVIPRSGPGGWQPAAFGTLAALATSFTFAPSKPMVGETVTFSGSAKSGTPPYNFSWDFGDGSNGTDATVTHAFASAGTFSVTLTATDSANSTATATKSVVVTGVLIADFTFNPTLPAAHESIAFSASASGGTSPYTYGWTFGDGGTGSGASVSHAYSTAGSYTVTLTVSDSAGHTTTASHTVPVTPPLIADFTFSPAQPVIGQTVTFTGTASGGTSPYVYSWTFGDGGTGTGATATHAYATSGTFLTTLAVSDSAGHITPVSKSVPVTSDLGADFTFSPAQPVVGETVSFSAAASGGTPPYTYAWTFGDGGTASGIGVNHAYASTGPFTITLTVHDAASHSVTLSKSITVTPPLTANFDSTPAQPASGDVITFSATASGGTLPYTYAWAFGDGGTGTGPSVNHTFGSGGLYSVTLTVSDSAGHSIPVTKSISVTSGLTADFTFSPGRPAIGETVTFSGTAAGGTSPYTYAWTFGDGGTGSGPIVSHAFAAADTYPVNLTVTDSVGHLLLVTKSISVASELSADFTFTPVSPVVGETISFSALVSGGSPPFTYAWNFGDGTTSAAATPGYTYARAGSYNVSLTVTDAVGRVASVVRVVSVALALFSDFIFTPSLPLAFEQINFSATVYGGTLPYALTWDFGDGSTASGPQVSHIYGTEGSFTVNLTCSDALGRVVHVSKTIIVSLFIASGFTLSQTFPVIGEVVTFSPEARGGNPPYTFAWNFGDGSTDTGAPVTHAYKSAGAFVVLLAVLDSAGQSSTSTRAILVTPPLAAQISISLSRPMAAEAITFTGLPAGGTPPYSFKWTFGDGSNATGAAVDHAFGNASVFNITLVLNDSVGHSATASLALLVTPSLDGNFTFSPIAPVALEKISFSANASGGTLPYTFNWRYGDADTGEGVNVSHAYASVRIFNVTLTISDSVGHVLELTQSISVGPSLEAHIHFTPDRPVTGSPVSFSGNASGGAPPYTYAWSFGDGASSREANASHTFSDLSFSTSYRVVLTVCDSAGRCASASETLRFSNLFLITMLSEFVIVGLVVVSWILRRRRAAAPEE